MTWKTKDLLNSESPIVLYGMRKLVDLNPDWKVTVYDDNEVDDYLKANLNYSDYELIQDAHIVVKSDLWRLIKIYYEGGLYIDIDRFCNISLSEIITSDEIKWVLPTSLDFDFSHDFMLSAPQNPAYFEAIQMYLQRRREGHREVYFLGPQTYMHAVTKTIFGEIINTDPGIEKFTEMRKKLESIPFIKTFREEPPHNTILYKDDSKSLDYETLKRSLYSDFKLKHWTGEW